MTLAVIKHHKTTDFYHFSIPAMLSNKNIRLLLYSTTFFCRPELGLQSVQRALILLHPEVLMLLDTVILDPESQLKRASSYFHNILHSFRPYRHAGLQGAQVIYPEGPYALFWLKSDGKPPTVQLQNQYDAPEARFRTTNFVNLTFDLNHEKPTRIAVVFFGPNVKASRVEFLKETNNLFARLRLAINDVKYDVTIASLIASVSQRMKYLGYGGYATVSANNILTQMGLEKLSKDQNLIVRCDVKDDVDMTKFVRSLVSTAKLKTDFNKATTEEISNLPSSDASFSPSYLIVSIVFLLAFAMFCLKVVRQRTSTRYGNVVFFISIITSHIGLYLFILLLSLVYFDPDQS